MKIARGLLAAALLTTAQCTHAPPSPRTTIVRNIALASNIHCSSDDCRNYTVDPAIRTQTAVSVACMGNTPPGQTPNPQPPPPSYLVSDIGKPGIPRLSGPTRTMIARIRRYVHSKTLRFAWVDATTMGEPIVFDAYDGPCEVEAVGYPVLNGSCNEYYQPGENPYSTHGAPFGCDHPSPRPWMDGR